MNTKKHMSLLVVLAMIIAYAIPFQMGSFAEDNEIVWTFADAPSGTVLENSSNKEKEWYITDVDLGNGLAAYSNGTLNEAKQEYSNAFEVDRTSSTEFTVGDSKETVVGSLKFGGKSTADGRYLTYTPVSDGTLTVYVKHGSPNKTGERTMSVVQGDDTTTVSVTAPDASYAVQSIGIVKDTEVKITVNDNVALAKIVFAPTDVAEPTSEPTSQPTTAPTTAPTSEPTSEPTSQPTTAPTSQPTSEPTTAPTEKPEEELSADEIAVRKDAQALVLKSVSQTAVYFDIDLDKTGSNGSKITWKSSNTEYIDIQTISHINKNYTGVVTRPAAEKCDETGGVPVTLTATLTKGDAVYTKTFDVSVRAWNPMYYNDFQTDVGGESEASYLEIADGVKAANGDTFRGIRVDTLKESRCFASFGHGDKDTSQYFDKRIMSTEDYGKPRGSDENEENFAFYYNMYKAYGGSTTYNPLWIKLIDPETGTAPEGIVMLSMDIYVITGEQKFNIGFGTSKASQMCRFLLGSGKSSNLGYNSAGYLRVFSNTASIDFMGGTGGYRHPMGEWVKAVLVANSETHKWDFYYDGMQIGAGLEFRNAEDVIPTIEFTMDRASQGGSYLIDNIYVENLTEDYRKTYWDAYEPDTLVYDEEVGAYVVDSPLLLQYQGTDGIAGSYFKWVSSNPDVLSISTQRVPVDDLASYGYSEEEIASLKANGYEDVSVNLATLGNVTEDTYITLTAKLEIGDTMNKKDFRVLVKANSSQNVTGDSAKALEDANAISSVTDGASVSSDLSLPTTGSKNGSTITWKSSNEKVISTTGAVTRPTGTSAVTVTLTATVKYGDAVQYKKFTVKVQPKTSNGGGGGGGGGSSSGGGGGSIVATDAEVTATAAPAPVTNQNPANSETDAVSFTDLYKAQWASDAIEYLFGKDIVNGYGDGTYGVNDDVTREQFVRMLLTALNIKLIETENNIFSDVADGTWYTNYVNTAWRIGIVSGISETEFGVGQPISRQDMAVMCIRALDYVNNNTEEVIEKEEETEDAIAMEETVEPEETAEPEEAVETEVTIDVSEIPFADRDEIADYALEAVARMAAAKYLSGDENGSFAPKKTSTRAETAVVIYRILIQEDL